MKRKLKFLLIFSFILMLVLPSFTIQGQSYRAYGGINQLEALRWGIQHPSFLADDPGVCLGDLGMGEGPSFDIRISEELLRNENVSITINIDSPFFVFDGPSVEIIVKNGSIEFGDFYIYVDGKLTLHYMGPLYDLIDAYTGEISSYAIFHRSFIWSIGRGSIVRANF